MQFGSLSLSLSFSSNTIILFLSYPLLLLTTLLGTILLSFLSSSHLPSPSTWSCKTGFPSKEMTLKGGTSQACAACKYQRRRCTAECVLAPYFPPDQPKMFQNAHKLFGVSNIVKILKPLDPAQKTEAMRSIIYQANIRDRYPVHGCLGIIWQLHYQLRQAEEELHAVHSQLALIKQQEISLAPTDSSTSQLQLVVGMTPPANAALTLFQPDTTVVPQQQFNPVTALPLSSFQSYSHSGNGNGKGSSSENGNGNDCYNSAEFIDSKDNMNAVNPFGSQQSSYSNDTKVAMSLQTLTIEEEATQDYDEIHPFFDTIDDRQSYIDSKEAYESSSESSLKDTTQSLDHVAENELKSAELQLGIISEGYQAVS